MGEQVTFADLASLDASEHASLKALLEAPLEEGTIFETFELSLGPQRPSRGEGGAGSAAAAAPGTVRLVPAGPHKKVRHAVLMVFAHGACRRRQQSPVAVGAGIRWEGGSALLRQRGPRLHCLGRLTNTEPYLVIVMFVLLLFCFYSAQSVSNDDAFP
jgi:hypothetical protein